MEKELKIKAFEHALILLKKQLHLIARGGFCYCLQDYWDSNVVKWVDAYGELGKPIEKTLFPELVKYRPEKWNIDTHWFSLDDEGIQKRIDIIIQELEKLRKT